MEIRIKNDDETILQAYQKEYLEKGSATAWAGLWEVSFRVCKNILYGYYAKNGLQINDEVIEEKGIIATEYVLRRYKEGVRVIKKNNNHDYSHSYHVGNFISTLNFGVKHALFHTNKERKGINDSLRFESVEHGELAYHYEELQYLDNKAVISIHNLESIRRESLLSDYQSLKNNLQAAQRLLRKNKKLLDKSDSSIDIIKYENLVSKYNKRINKLRVEYFSMRKELLRLGVIH